MSLTVNEMEAKLAILENQNFELKMKIYYLVNKEPKKENDNLDESVLEENNSLLKQKDGEIVALKDTNRILRCQISDLQDDVVQLRLKLTALAASNANAGVSTANSIVIANANQFEENRKKEKEATLALVQHDEYIIKQLQEEIRTLRTQHIQDSEILGECAEKNTILSSSVHKLESELKELNQYNLDLKNQVGLYKDQLRRQDILLMKEMSQLESLSPMKLHNETTGAHPADHSNAVEMEQSFQHSVASPVKGGDMNASNGAFHISPKQVHLESLLFDQSSITPNQAQTEMNPNTRAKSPSPMKINHSYSQSPVKMVTNGFLDFGAQTAWDELHQLRLDKNTLLETIAKLEAKCQADASNWDKERIELEDMLQVAAEELDGCEEKYKHLRTKYEALKKKYRAGESNRQSLQDRVLELQQERDESFAKFDMDASHSMSLHRAHLSKQKTNKRRSSVNSTTNSDASKHQESLSFSPHATANSPNKLDSCATAVGNKEMELEQSILEKNKLIEQYR